MVRLYAVKGRKKRARVEEEPQQQEAEAGDEVFAEENKEITVEGDGGENPAESTVEDDRKAEEAIDRTPGISFAGGIQEPGKKPGVIFVLERACLEVAKVGRLEQSRSRTAQCTVMGSLKKPENGLQLKPTPSKNPGSAFGLMHSRNPSSSICFSDLLNPSWDC